MPTLSDYLGQVVSSIATARMQSDMESVRLADHYASHPLLKHFSVPRFRVMNVKLDMPVAIHNIDDFDALRGKTQRAHFAVDSGPLVDALDAELETAGIALDAPAKKRIEQAIHTQAATVQRVDVLSTSTTHIVDTITNTLRRELTAAPDVTAQDREAFLARFTDTARSRLLTLHPGPQEINVIVNNAELRDMGPLELMTRIQVTLTEEGMEWKQIESGGEALSRLRPE